MGPVRNRRTILLTGATGYLGSHLALAFLERGYRLKALVRPKGLGSELRLKQVFDDIRPTPLPLHFPSGQLEVIPGDITLRHFGLSARKALSLAAEVTDVVHCAAMASFDSSKVTELRQVNVDGTKNVLEFIDEATFHYVSTAFVTGHQRGKIGEEALDDRAGFNNTYEESKFLAELEVQKASAGGVPSVIYRPSIIVGDSRTGETQSFVGFYFLLKALALVAMYARRTLEGKPLNATEKGIFVKNGKVWIPLRIEGSESKTLNIIPIDYVVSLMMAIFLDSENVGRVYHIVNTAPPTIGQLRDWMCEALGIGGITLEERCELEQTPMNYWEQLFAKNTQAYGAYLGGEEPMFLTENTLRIAQRAEIIQPPTDGNFVRLLTNYCLESRWGKRRVKVPSNHLSSPTMR